MKMVGTYHFRLLKEGITSKDTTPAGQHRPLVALWKSIDLIADKHKVFWIVCHA